jgi:hypothetical protein
MRRLIYIGVLLATVIGSFFLTPWQLEEGPDTSADATDARSDGERLASQRIADYSDLRRAARNAGLTLSHDMIANVDGFSRVNERDVAISGWLADPEGDETPIKIMVFVAGSVAATTQTNGERADVTRERGLAFGTEKNVTFGVNFACSAGQQPVAVGLGIKRKCFPLELPRCP